MNSPEVFYLHINGTQRGPYTIRHIDHLLNSGLITEDTLFWREGLEQWAPVTQLVARRVPKNRWKRPLKALIALIPLAVLAYVFGPITLDGWREIYQHDFTREAAYWRAREIVRAQCLPRGVLVEFEDEEDAAVELSGSDSGSVLLHGTVADRGSDARAAAWKVQLHYDAARREWSGVEASEVAAK